MSDGIINFNLNDKSAPMIKVIGVGGGGGNAAEYMYKSGICDVDFFVCNTDKKSLLKNAIPNKIHLGVELTGGHGAGNDPNVGEKAALESIEEIEKMLKNNTKMVFITAAMGGGTGTGAAPVVASIAKQLNILTVGIVAIPERQEGTKRVKQAIEGLKRMRDNVDCLIVIDNERINELYQNETLRGGYDKANEVLNVAAKGIAEIITLHGYINVDFADVNTVMNNSGVAVIGTGKASGENRAVDSISMALDSPLLNNRDIQGAKNILLNITSGADEIYTNELMQITDFIIRRAGNNASVIWGVGTDEKLGDAISVTVIATGFPADIIQIDNNTIEQFLGKIEIDNAELKVGINFDNLNNLKKIPAFKRRTLMVK